MHSLRLILAVLLAIAGAGVTAGALEGAATTAPENMIHVGALLRELGAAMKPVVFQFAGALAGVILITSAVLVLRIR